MNMNEQEWQDEEFWDSEHGDDEDFNDIGSDVDANNDETFDNAAEWNEDEHEELIARDSILSHSINQQPQHRHQQHHHHHQQQLHSNHHKSSQRNEQHRTTPPLSSSSHKTSLDGLTRAFPLETTLQVLRVDELEQQFMRTRISSQPPEPPQEHHHHHQQQHHNNHHTTSQRNEQHRATPPLSSSSHRNSLDGLTRAFPLETTRQVLRVDELEQQLMRTRVSSQPPQQQPNPHTQLPTAQILPETSRPHIEMSRRSGWSPFGGKDLCWGLRSKVNNGNRYGGGDARDSVGRPNHHREEREYSRDNNNRRQDNYDRRKYNDNRRRFIIIPPQVQLSVIEKVVQHQPNSVVRPGEFLQDKVIPFKEGLLYKRIPTLLNDRMNHDGILTEKERSWLTKIQEKIQADYDDKLDQDYYYLLYFNRTSKTNGSTSKSCGSGVLDRRFIPRERLLYNSST